MLELRKQLPVEIRLAGDESDGSMTFEGYGAYFGNVDSYGDVIEKGAFRRTLREAKRSGTWPSMLLQHGNWLGGDDNMPVGIWTEMSEDQKGLVVEGQLADTARGRDAYALLKMKPRPAITGLSIGFRVKEFTLGTKPKEPRRTIKDVELLEVSLVTFPANDKARVTAVKSGLNARGLEADLRSELGLSSADAVTAVSLVKRHLGDPEGLSDEDYRDGEGLDEVAELIRQNTGLLRG